jgi:hypothetical protein
MEATDFLTELFAKRGIPSVGGLSYQFINSSDINNITMSFHAIDPLTCRSEHFYDTRNNILFRKKLLSKNHAVWEQIFLV